MGTDMLGSLVSFAVRCASIVEWWYFQYTIHLGIEVLETWERRLVNSVLIGLFAMASYTTYLFLPGHISMWMHFFNTYGATTETAAQTEAQGTAPEVTS